MTYEEREQHPPRTDGPPENAPLEEPLVEITEPPLWYRRALAAPRESRRVEVDGTAVHYLIWGAPASGEPAKPGIVFVHGNGAHAEWFAHIAPFLAGPDMQVASMDLAGMGESAWRPDRYTRESYAKEIFAVTEHAGMAPGYVVGHSFGGFVSLVCASDYGDRLGGVILVDYGVRPPEEHEEWFADNPPPRPTRVYPDFETALGRFRLAPDQPVANRFIFDHIARTSLREATPEADALGRTAGGAGWTWKFDPGIFYGLTLGRDLNERFQAIACPKAVVMGALSWNGRKEVMDYHRKVGGAQTPVFAIPEARHHVMLDQPHAFTMAIAGLVAAWEAQRQRQGGGGNSL